jgi:hypothetical protein
MRATIVTRAGVTATLAGITVAGMTLAGCTGGGSHPPPGPGSVVASVGNDPALVQRSATGSPSTSGAGQVLAPDPRVMPVAGPKTKHGARAAAARFASLYFAGKFSDAWQLLTEASRRAIPLDAWTGVHNACGPRPAATPGAIVSVVVFGNTALVTQAVPAGTGTSDDTYVLAYDNGQWVVSPDDKGTYSRGSITADIAAAKSAGYCGHQKVY